eukprot:17802-Heterococcus_DN1.PRE.1
MMCAACIQDAGDCNLADVLAELPAGTCAHYHVDVLCSQHQRASDYHHDGFSESVRCLQLGVYNGEECNMKAAVCLRDYCGQLADGFGAANTLSLNMPTISSAITTLTVTPETSAVTSSSWQLLTDQLRRLPGDASLLKLNCALDLLSQRVPQHCASALIIPIQHLVSALAGVAATVYNTHTLTQWVRMWNLQTGECVREIVGRSGAAILTSRLTGMRLFSCSHHKRAKPQIRPLTVHGTAVDGDTKCNTVVLWRSASQELSA